MALAHRASPSTSMRAAYVWLARRDTVQKASEMTRLRRVVWPARRLEIGVRAVNCRKEDTGLKSSLAVHDPVTAQTWSMQFQPSGSHCRRQLDLPLAWRASCSFFVRSDGHWPVSTMIVPIVI